MSCSATNTPRVHGLPSSSSYTQPGAWRPDPESQGLYDTISRAALSAGASLSPDPSLSQVALSLARRLAADPAGLVPSAGVIQALSWQAGVSDPIPSVITLRGTLGNFNQVLPDEISDIVRSDHPTHVGIGRATLDGRSAIAIALTQRRIRLEPIPRRVSVGDRVQLRGSLLAGLHMPTLAITHPDGHTEENPLGEGPDFFGQFPASARGVYQVEVTAESTVGSTVVANFPVYVDTAPPSESEALREPVAGAESEDPTAVEAALLRLLNDARNRNRLGSLQSTTELAETARAHSRDMADNRFVAHVSQRHGGPGDRLRAAGLSSGMTLENVARGYSAQEIHDGLMRSPGHRANILNPRVTHVGVGVVRESAPGGGLLVTEDFIEVAAVIDLAAAPTALLEGINRVRSARGATALSARAQLSGIADEAARSFFTAARPSQEQVLDAATARVSREGLLYRRVSIAAVLGARLDELDHLEPLLERSMNVVGIGIAQGDRPDAPPRSVFVVYVLAVTR